MEDSVQIKKFELSDIPQFGNLCDDSEWYSPQVKATTGALLRYKEYRDNCFVAYEGTELVGFIYGSLRYLVPAVYVCEREKPEGWHRETSYVSIGGILTLQRFFNFLP